jgi:DNA polymerase (family X)
LENNRIATVFDRIADVLEIQGENLFRVRSYRSAARAVGDMAERLSDLVAAGRDLEELPGIGKSLAAKIHEILATGSCKLLEELRKQLPPHLPDLLGVKGLGPKKVKVLYEQLHIENLDQLKAAAETGKIRDLEGMGEKTEQNILKGLATLEAEAGRISVARAVEHVAAIGRHLAGIKPVKSFEPAGSYRRRRETVGDLDFIIQATDREVAAREILAYESIEEPIAAGHEKISVRLASGPQVDFRFVEPEAAGAALLYFTGSKAHNITLRKRAQGQGFKLNEYGLFQDEKYVAGRTEMDVYSALGLKEFIPPELREDHGEIDAAAEGRLPKLIERGDIRGDLHAHTTATDGVNSIEEMVAAARDRGYQYLAITDHSKAVTVAHGLSDDALRRHADRVRKAAADLKRFWLMAGVEVDILKDGRLDIGQKVLEDLDWVVASVHSSFEMPEEKMTERIVRAVESGVVHALGHPLGRLIGHRDPIRFDADRVFEACRKANVFLEINAYPDRLDLPDVYCRRAREIGCMMVISTDSHRTADLDLIGFGVNVARRGWLEKNDVLNTLSVTALKKRLKRK